MGEEAPGSGKKSWLKTALGTVGGLVSGACVMYLTAAFDKVIKPGKPVANFKVEADGLNVRFQNLAPKGSQGWWDFGDGSPLEPVSDQEFAAHAYPAPGEYTVKMSLENLLGETGERSAPVHLQGTAAGPAAPHVTGMKLEPLIPGAYAPATFRLTCQVANAQCCVLDGGDEHLQFLSDPAQAQERFVSFMTPGTHRVRLLAVNGAQHDEQIAQVSVQALPAGTVGLMLTVTDQATRVRTTNRQVMVSAFDRQVAADPGCEIVDVRVKGPKGEVAIGTAADLPLDSACNPGVQGLCLHVAKDRHSMTVSGTLAPSDAAKKGKAPMPRLALPVTLVQQRRTAETRTGAAGMMAGMVQLPTQQPVTSATVAYPPLPPEWTDVRRTAVLVVMDGTGASKSVQLPLAQPVIVAAQGHNWLLNATTPAGNQAVRVELRPAPGSPLGN
jgi:hypothetical protein